MVENKRYWPDPLQKMTAEVFVRSGYAPEAAEIIADVLLTSDRMGIESHGIQRLILYQYGIRIGRIRVDAQPAILNETPLSVVMDANAGMGQIASCRAMRMAIGKAKQTGFGMALVRNSNHFGIAGYYSLMAAKEGLLGIAMTNTQALVTPTFGKTPLLGTNPIALSMPADPVPFHLDMSTSVVTAGKMEVYAKNGEVLPEGWLVSADGSVSTDAAAFVADRGKTGGALLPLGGAGELYGGHKGYGLSMAVELMTGILSGGVPSTQVRKVNERELCCHMFAAIDYGRFTGDKARVEREFSDLLRTVRDSEKAAGASRIYTHGEKEFESMHLSGERGVPISLATYGELICICADKGLNPDDYIVEV